MKLMLMIRVLLMFYLMNNLIEQTCAARVLSGGAGMREDATRQGLVVSVTLLPFSAPHFRSTARFAQALRL